jgi:hypothetical protein
MFEKEDNIEVRFIVTEPKLAHKTEVRLIRYFKPVRNTIMYIQPNPVCDIEYNGITTNTRIDDVIPF